VFDVILNEVAKAIDARIFEEAAKSNQSMQVLRNIRVLCNRESPQQIHVWIASVKFSLVIIYRGWVDPMIGERCIMFVRRLCRGLR